MKNLAINFLFLCFVTFSNAQNISGKVFDATSKQPLEKVNIYISNNSKIGTSSDKNGYFSLKLKKNIKQSDSITFSIVGYQTYKTTIQSLKGVSNNIFLTKKTNIIDEVVIKHKRLRNRLRFTKVRSLKSGLFAFASKRVANKLYIFGGDKSIEEENLSIAVDIAFEKAGGNPLPKDGIFREMSPSLNTKLYSDNLFIYNLDENNLEKSAINFQKRAYHQTNFYDDNFYVLGGKKVNNLNNTEYLLNTIEVFNTNTSKLQVDKVNPHKAVNFSSFVYKDHLIVLGGSTKIKKNGKKAFADKIHLFNLKTGLWHEVGKMPNPRETSGVLSKDKIYLIGGNNNKPTTAIESWNLTNNSWQVEGELFSALKNPALTHHKNTIYIFENGKLIVYDVLKKTLKEYKILLKLKDANMHFYKNSLYILGGNREKRFVKEPSSSIYKVDINELKRTKINKLKILEVKQI